MPDFSRIKEEAYRANIEIPKQNLAIFTWGNVSAYDRENKVFAIKPSGVPYSELTSEKMVVVDLEGKVIEGNLNPSSDTPTHAVLYKEFAVNQNCGIGGIVHTHSTYATSWAQSLNDVPLFGTTHADHIQKAVPCTPYLSKDAVQNDYEKETGLLITEYFKEKGFDADEINMVLVGGHGPFCWAKSALEAVNTAKVLEEICRMALYTKIINPESKELPGYIIEKHYTRKHGKNAYYGQKK